MIEVQQGGRWKFTHVQHLETMSLLCYPLGNEHVLSVYLTGTAVLSGEEQLGVVELNAELLTTINLLVGGDSQ
ncbi:MAG: hypothetical protein H7X86_02505 [Gorillibacterium sp.]|nr:hypothetical protein [Gorillibacterium sp.]